MHHFKNLNSGKMKGAGAVYPGEVPLLFREFKSASQPDTAVTWGAQGMRTRALISGCKDWMKWQTNKPMERMKRPYPFYNLPARSYKTFVTREPHFSSRVLPEV